MRQRYFNQNGVQKNQDQKNQYLKKHEEAQAHTPWNERNKMNKTDKDKGKHRDLNRRK